MGGVCKGVPYLFGLVHVEEGWNHRLPQTVLVMPQVLILHSRIGCHKKLKRKKFNNNDKLMKHGDILV